jgi:hypothetical protein
MVNNKPDYTTEYQPSQPPTERNNIPFLVMWLSLGLCTAFAWQLWAVYVHWLVWLAFICLSLLMMVSTLSLSGLLVAKVIEKYLPLYEQFNTIKGAKITTLGSPFMSPPPPPTMLATKKPLAMLGGDHD